MTAVDDENCRLSYAGKAMLAPMVRIGTLPTRLMALRYGADVVYTEEMVDFKMLKTKRIENELLGTVDFVMDDGTVAFRTCTEERDRVVFQIGTSHPKRALIVAKLVEKDVAGVDINMGCPKTFSISGGMGAALLRQPELVKQILTELVENLSIPVTCKIRCLESVEKTIEFSKMVQATGITALAVHGRTRDERPRHTCRHHYIREIAQRLNIPVIANGGSGDIKKFSDIEAFRLACGTSSVMVARAAQWNVSIFSKEGLSTNEQLIKEYIKIAIDYDNHWTNTKYCIQQILGSEVQSDEGTQLLASKSPEDIYVIYGMLEYYKKVNARHRLHLQRIREVEERDYDTVRGLKVKVVRDEAGCVISYESNHSYDRKVSNRNQTPKMYLYTHLMKLHGPGDNRPTFSFTIDPDSNRFKCTLDYEGVKYSSNQWHKRKVWSEQAVCQIYMQLNDIVDKTVVGGDLTSGAEAKPADKSRSHTRKISLDGEEVEITVTKDINDTIISYAAHHRLGSKPESSVSPMDRLCLHLLEKKQSEPEYDSITEANGSTTCCTLRHSGVEYTNNYSFDTKKEAVNSVCLMYILLNKVGANHQSEVRGEKRKLAEDGGQV